MSAQMTAPSHDPSLPISQDNHGNGQNTMRDNAQHESSATPSTQRQDSPKRKPSEVAGDDGPGKKKRRKVNHACVYCRRSHMTCDLERPCARCVKRDIGHLCHDEPREGPKRNKSEASIAEIAPAPEEGGQQDSISNTPGGAGQMNGVGGVVQQQYPRSSQGNGNMGGSLNGGTNSQQGTAVGQQQHLAQPQPVSPTQLQRQQTGTNSLSNPTQPSMQMQPQNFDWNNSGLQSQFQDMHHLHPNYMFNTSEVTNEYNLLNDFLSSSLLDDGVDYSNNDAQTLFNDPFLSTSSINALSQNFGQPPASQMPNQNQQQGQQPPQQQQQQQPQQQQQQPSQQMPPPQNLRAGEDLSRPSSTLVASDKARDKYFLTAADPAGLASAGDRLHKLLRAKYEAGMLKPFNYVKGYARLQSYMSRHLHPSSQRRILDQLGRFRPKFREAMQSLTDMQLVLVEMWFERSLMEYDRVFASMAIPACCWRRTGEIFRGNREMAELIGVPMERLRDGRLAIHEIIAEESLVSYWEKFGAIAFDQSQKAILTSCTLKQPGPDTGEQSSNAPNSTMQSRKGSQEGEKDRPGQTNHGGNGAGKEKAGLGERTQCCFSFTIRRDNHNIPALIVGNFLPIRPRRQQ